MYRDGYGNGVSREIAVRFGWIYRTDIETGEYLLRCLLYVDLNMVRAGVVSHPEQWRHVGSNEIQHPRRKKSSLTTKHCVVFLVSIISRVFSQRMDGGFNQPYPIIIPTI